jgi:hypothetical protein
MAASSARAQTIAHSTLDDQTSVEVTVYNSNIGLVKDTRTINLSRGQGELRFMDVAEHINPVTVHVKSLNKPGEFMVLEQNYEYDLMDPDKLLDKYVGKQIKIIDHNEYQDKKEVLDATLLSNNNGQIFKINDEIYLGHPGYKVLPKIPDNLISKPTLTWLYDNTSSQPHNIQASYLTNNLSWKADYVLVLDRGDRQAGLNGWVTLTNQSGTAYNNAKLKLIAGEVNRVQANVMAKSGRMEMFTLSEMDAPQFEEQVFFEYHIYDLARKTSIKNNQQKQISLIEADQVDVKKEFLVDGQPHYFMGQYGGQDIKPPVNVFAAFKNARENNLGMPLPAGTMRMYKVDAAGSLQFIGEDAIEHTPKDEEVKLKIGKAFDIVAERKQTDYRKIASNIVETEWNVILRNHKDEDVVVSLLEPMQGDWQILESSHPYQKKDAFTVRYDIQVPKDKEVTVIYRTRIKY